MLTSLRTAGIFVVPLLLIIISPLFAQQRPLETDDPNTLASGMVRIQLGFEYLQNRTFTLSGLEGDLTRLGVIGFFAGVGPHVEFQTTGSLLNALNIHRRFLAYDTPRLSFQGNSTTSVGDFTLATKFALMDEGRLMPAMAFRFGVELPNAGNEKGLGNDQTNFYANILLGKTYGRWRTIANLGLAILGNPTTVSSQKDQFTFGGAICYDLNKRWTLLGEIHGRQGPSGPGTDEQAQLRFGARIHTGNFRWDFAGISGFRQGDPDSGVVLGASYEFHPFHK
jgi:hypothetical protein